MGKQEQKGDTGMKGEDMKQKGHERHENESI